MAGHGDLIKSRRKAKAWTQEQLAGIAGIDVRTVQRIEAGKGSIESLKAIADAFDVDVERLLISKAPVTQPEDEESRAPLQLLESDLDGDLAEAEFEMKRLDALKQNRPEHQKAQARHQKQIILQGLVKRFREAKRPARAWELQRRIERIRKEGKVATASQKRFDTIVDIEAERDAFREDESRRKRLR